MSTSAVPSTPCSSLFNPTTFPNTVIFGVNSRDASQQGRKELGQKRATNGAGVAIEQNVSQPILTVSQIFLTYIIRRFSNQNSDKTVTKDSLQDVSVSSAL